MPGRPIDNERKACDAVARALERLCGTLRANAYSPEDRGAPAPVEYVFDLSGVQYAIEHTIVEAFTGQISQPPGFALTSYTTTGDTTRRGVRGRLVLAVRKEKAELLP